MTVPSILRSPPAFLQGKDGSLSGSRAILFIPAGIVFGLWIITLAAISWWGAKWPTYEGAFDWATNFILLILAPYVANAIAGGMANMGGGDAAATVVNVGKEGKKPSGSAVAVATGGDEAEDGVPTPQPDRPRPPSKKRVEPDPYQDDESS